MTIRTTAVRLAMAAVCAGALLTGPALVAPDASAEPCTAGQVNDPITGLCWNSSQMGTGISGTGGTCLPGRLGLCLGALQNSQLPGDNLPTNTGVTSGRRTWP